VAEAAPLTDELSDDAIARPPIVENADASAVDAGDSSGADELDYFTRLEGEPADDELVARPADADEPAAPAAQPAVVTRPVTEQPSRLSAAPPAPPVSAATESAAAAGDSGDWAVQVAALNSSADADVVARQWGQKGYQAYVVTPSDGTPAVYRVRIGAFKTRQEADALASKLQQEERISPWVTR
jgi:cell division septation protein DedD